jgi:hypothetical protein
MTVSPPCQSKVEYIKEEKESAVGLGLVGGVRARCDRQI